MRTIIALLLSIMIAFIPTAEKQDSQFDPENIHSRTGIIYTVDYNNDLVYVVDSTDHVWAFCGIEDWLIGDIISFTLLDTNNTPNSIWDDEIISVSYSGWTLETQELNLMLNSISANN